jgi:hypothetical protein
VNISAPQVFLMRLLDVAGALVAVVVLAPLFAIAALLILAGDGRPGREFWKCPQALRTWLAWRSGMSRMLIIDPSFCRKSFDSICIISGRDRCRAILGCCG